MLTGSVGGYATMPRLPDGGRATGVRAAMARQW